jgi:predicted aspartyl protease
VALIELALETEQTSKRPVAPILGVTIRHPRAARLSPQSAAEVVATTRTVRALIDTGAQQSSITQALAKALGLKSHGKVWAVMADGRAEQQDVTDVSVSVICGSGDNRAEVELSPSLPVLMLNSSKADMLFGVDLLANCVLIYNGPGGHFTLYLNDLPPNAVPISPIPEVV